jgi:hypothetical protein
VLRVTAPPLTLRTVAGGILVGGLLCALVFGLLWAFNPAEGGGLSFSGEVPETTATETATPQASPPIDPEATAAPTPEATETGPTTEELEALIAAAADPEDTTVQVLDAGGGSSRTQAAAAALLDLGYDIIGITSARANVTRTTVWFTDGNADAGAALRARDDRIAQVEENEGLSSSVDLHLLVGPDWSS